jgi:thiol:disulfide interchange protein DsbA
MHNFLKLSILALLLPAALCNAQSNTSSFAFQDGVDFEALARPVAVEDSSKIELTEVFWYGCIHCFRLEPMLKEFAATLPVDVNLVKVPAMWHETMELHAKIYFASQALGITDQIHDGVFSAMNEQRNTLANEQAILKLVEDLGQDEVTFQRAFNSFGVNSQVTQAKSKTAAYGIRGTPELIVNGKYRISTSMTGTQQQMLVVAEALIDRERAMLQGQ